MKKSDVRKYIESIEGTISKFQGIISNLEQDIFTIYYQKQEDLEPVHALPFLLQEQQVSFDLTNVVLIYFPTIDYSLELDHKNQVASLTDHHHLNNSRLQELPTYWVGLRRHMRTYPPTESKFQSFSFGDRGIQLSIEDGILDIAQTEYGYDIYELSKKYWMDYYKLEIVVANDIIKSLQLYLKLGQLACLINSSTRQYIKLLTSYKEREDSEQRE
ncbi:hypothetical protein [Risungbinella massiliensis]|uniref:hypothetical protein n=1 Tax=Risungbinella massiliensis TaxID=1329796 RepID=UPI0005CC7F75|nr:hypothetical protein [Risungbinella massiliensis]